MILGNRSIALQRSLRQSLSVPFRNSRLDSRSPAPLDFTGIHVAVLTGETRSANVYAEEDMVLWALSLVDFDEISVSCRPLQDFLTDISTERLCSRKITAERSIGRYTISDMTAEGGWSLVYKGVHAFLNFPVAIKMLKHNMARDPDFLDKFQNEAKIIARLTPEKYQEVGRVRLIEPNNRDAGRLVVWSHPAFANRSVYARNDGEIVCASLAKE